MRSSRNFPIPVDDYRIAGYSVSDSDYNSIFNSKTIAYRRVAHLLLAQAVRKWRRFWNLCDFFCGVTSCIGRRHVSVMLYLRSSFSTLAACLRTDDEIHGVGDDLDHSELKHGLPQPPYMGFPGTPQPYCQELRNRGVLCLLRRRNFILSCSSRTDGCLRTISFYVELP